MSRYVTIKTLFKDKTALLTALMETGKWRLSQIEIHTESQHLFGYTGDQRKEKAHIIIRKRHVGSASNDIGFVKTADETYEAIISEYDSNKYGVKWVGQLKANYAFHKLKLDQEERGRTVTRERCPGTNRQRIEITGYR